MARKKVLPVDVKLTTVLLRPEERDYLDIIAQENRLIGMSDAMRLLIAADRRRAALRARRKDRAIASEEKEQHNH